MAQPTKLIVGLGNPGPDYVFTRHNIGFMAVDALAPASNWQKKFGGEIQQAEIAGVFCLFLKPQTYMNLSGEAVGEALRFYKLAAPDVIVFHDDIDLPPATVKIKRGGGHAGHNGLKSIDAHIGQDYWRIRLGVGHPGDRNLVHDYVLGRFAKSDRIWLEPLLEALVSGFKLMLEGKDVEYVRGVVGKMGAK